MNYSFNISHPVALKMTRDHIFFNVIRGLIFLHEQLGKLHWWEHNTKVHMIIFWGCCTMCYKSIDSSLFFTETHFINQKIPHGGSETDSNNFGTKRDKINWFNFVCKTAGDSLWTSLIISESCDYQKLWSNTAHRKH